MTKYICECASLNSLHTCTCEADGMPPKMCCISGCRIGGWRKSEEQEVETPAPKLPEWIKAGAWCYIHSGGIGTGKYQKIEAVHSGFVKTEYLVPIENISEARLRPWTYKEAIGKTVFWKFDNSKKEIASMIDSADDEGNVYVFGYGELKAKKLMMEERFSQSDGSPCGVLEHKNEQGEWEK